MVLLLTEAYALLLTGTMVKLLAFCKILTMEPVTSSWAIKEAEEARIKTINKERLMDFFIVPPESIICGCIISLRVKVGQ